MRQTRPSCFPEAALPPSLPGSRLRTWAARLVLLMACAGTVATSQPRSESVSSGELVGEPVRLTTAAPEARRGVVVRVSAPEVSSLSIEGELRVRVTARWFPDNPDETTTPWLRVFVGESGDGSNWDGSSVLEVGKPATVEVFEYLTESCKVDAGCEWPQDVRFELQPDAAPGTVELEWAAQGSAWVMDTTDVPKGFIVSVSAP